MISVFSSPSRYTQGKLADPPAAVLQQIAERATARGETIHNEPFAVRADMVADALLAADAAGRAWKRRHG